LKRLILIDGNSFCYRAFYAIRNLSTSKGVPTNAVYGFITMLNKIIKEQKPDYLAIAFDLKEPTFRHKKYEDYKIHRKPMPDELVEQMPRIKEVAGAYGFATYELAGYEADDILATIAKKISGKGLEVCIVTGDKDILQFVDENIKVLSPHKDDLIYNTEKVRERYGVDPAQIVELISLMGDSSDNIPGVPGIGEKTAVKLIQEFSTLENLMNNLSEVKREHLRKTLEENKKSAILSKELATVDINVPIKFDLDSMHVDRPDEKRLYELFKELEFKRLLKEFAPGGAEETGADYKLITEEKDFQKLLKQLGKLDEFAFDMETTSADPVIAEPVGVSFCWKSAQAYYVPMGKNRGIKDVLKRLKPILEDPDIKKIGQNIKYEKIILSRKSIALKGISFDTMVAAYILNPSKPSYSLDNLALEFLDYKKISIEELIGKGKNQITMDEVDLDKVCQYGCEDSDITFRLKGILEDKLEQKGLQELFANVELPLIDVLADMELDGVSIDTKLLQEMSKRMASQLEKLQKKIHEIAGCEFNINSPKQLSVILFEKLELPVIKKTKTGFSTDEGVLQTLAVQHALPATILEFRQLSKLKSTYVDALPALINPATGRVHTSFNQTVAATGRLSSSQPNLQNIPIKTEAGRSIRRAFVPSSAKNILLSADYSQIELRILAHLANDENMKEAFRQNRDIHAHTASLIFDVEEDGVDNDMRASAKTVNFGIVYGISSYGLARELGIRPAEAKNFIDAYFERYPSIREYFQDKIEQARSEGLVTTLLNRRRYIPEINSSQITIRQFAERTAVNTPIQGTAADLIKLAMINIQKALKDEGFASRMILQVHDELVLMSPRMK